MQNTISNPITISGIGIHSGKEVIMRLLPAKEDYGIIFISIDGREVQAKFDNVHSTNMSTKLLNKQFSVDLVEHLMAGIWGCNIDNLIIEIDGNEVPIMAGNSKGFIDEINKVGIQSQNAPRKILKVTETIKVAEEEKYVRISPNDKGLIIDMTIDFQHKAIGEQRFIFDSLQQSFIEEIAPARTFGFVKDLDYLRSNGLALGASLDNCIGLTENGIANDEGLLFKDEFVRHKILDCVGDLFLSGYYPNCRVTAYKTGHKLNNLALKKLFESSDSYEIV
jgi:UDP-3-O-[3-hydroxymyristoyl] N-acetylglucosamine deacetylase